MHSQAQQTQAPDSQTPPPEARQLPLQPEAQEAVESVSDEGQSRPHEDESTESEHEMFTWLGKQSIAGA